MEQEQPRSLMETIEFLSKAANCANLGLCEMIERRDLMPVASVIDSSVAIAFLALKASLAEEERAEAAHKSAKQSAKGAREALQNACDTWIAKSKLRPESQTDAFVSPVSEANPEPPNNQEPATIYIDHEPTGNLPAVTTNKKGKKNNG